MNHNKSEMTEYLVIDSCFSTTLFLNHHQNTEIAALIVSTLSFKSCYANCFLSDWNFSLTDERSGTTNGPGPMSSTGPWNIHSFGTHSIGQRLGHSNLLLIIPRHEVEGGYRFRCRPSVRHSVIPSFRSSVPKSFPEHNSESVIPSFRPSVPK